MGKRILMVNDERDLAYATKLYLEAEGYEVVTAYDGVEALEVLTDPANCPDLIILDSYMPRMSGYDALRALRSREQSLTTPVMMLSACAPDAPENAICRELADGYTQYPFDPSQLLAWIDARLCGMTAEERADLAAWRQLRFGGELTPETAAAHLSGHYGLVTIEAQAALREMGPAAVPVLTGLATRDDEAGCRAAHLLCERRQDDTVDAVVSLLVHPTRERRWEALAALGELASDRGLLAIAEHGQSVLDEIVAALSGADESLRRTAAYALKRIRTPEALRALRDHEAQP
ncbi:MAG: response regulator [Armatimonadetes bacterium]|nr:response regulator [Armatimonadota bacterium]